MKRCRASINSGVATGGQGGQSATPDSEKFAKNQEKEGKNQEKSEKRGRIGKKRQQSRECSFTLPLLTDRAGYASSYLTMIIQLIIDL